MNVGLLAEGLVAFAGFVLPGDEALDEEADLVGSGSVTFAFLDGEVA